ncbi:hypothetical protein L1987_14593 [Smallanthus sonchifolius]|uniref:Uncharacterized protein n=1 Tax=Smallanthus sonchifolius TaxID=185202 RepID=A0ACB9J352_9ASTR|nr:hypothetical protein L1987_14593 [Smallanthus sonchifolius]
MFFNWLFDVWQNWRDGCQASEFILAKERVWGNSLSSAALWNGNDIPFDRITGLKIVGVPFKLREGDVYDQIGGLFGKVIWPSNFSWSNIDNSSGQCYVLTEIGGRIEEEINLTWRDSSYKVWVTEESNSWVPIFSGIPSSESSSSSDNEYQALEEGEILQDVEGSLGDGNSPENPSLAPDEGQVNFPPIPVLVNEQLSGDDRPSDKLQGGDNLFRMGTNLGSSRGSSPSQFKFGGSKARAITRKKMVGPVSLGGPGPHKVSPMGINSRKRPRVISSPDSVFPSAAGIPNPLLDDSNLGNACPDLNASPKLLQSDQMVSPEPNRSEDPGTTVGSLNVSTSAADFQSKEFQHFDMDLEVQETLSTGSCIGIDLTGHEGLVRAVIQGLKTSLGAHFISLQETKIGGKSEFKFHRFWGKTIFEPDYVEAVGSSGGIVCIWDPGVFTRSSSFKHRHFLVISGTLKLSGVQLNVVNVYAPNDGVARREVWAELFKVRLSFPGLWIIMGDFNDVRSPDERFNSEFVASYADCFNDFIEAADLLEYHMGGYKFTYMSDKGDKLSKLDRMLVCRSFMNLWPVASLTALSKEMSDHCPLFLSTVPVDFGHIPFRFFNSWLDLP